jgi:isoleucyl-tRNA synthetase
LSRDRFWGTPIPVWRCTACHHDQCVGSVAELGERAGRDLTDLDLHRPYVDEIVIPCAECGADACRVEPVLGVVRFQVDASEPVPLPFEKDLVRATLPRRLLCEASEARLVLLLR